MKEGVLQQSVGQAPAEQRQLRGWTEDEWTSALAELQERGWIDADGTATDTGRAARERLEDATDRPCDAFMDRESRAHALAVSDAVRAAARSVVGSGGVAFPNAAGNARP